jgi:quercetin dioxygenase-like cupin family protein
LAPGQALALLRITFAPGGSVTSHTHPGETVYHLAAGTLQFTLEEGEAQLVRAVDGAPAAATPTAEAIAVGEEITLSAGDTIYYDAAVLQSERNDGDEDAVVLVSNLRGVDEPARQFQEDMAASTPAA